MLSEELLRWADLLLVMTNDHLQAILHYWPDAGVKTRLLADPDDVGDPYGGPIEVYRQTLQQMMGPLRALADRLYSPDKIPSL